MWLHSPPRKDARSTGLTVIANGTAVQVLGGTALEWMLVKKTGCFHSPPRVSTEMSLHVLAYNLKRVMKIMGTGPLITVMQA